MKREAVEYVIDSQAFARSLEFLKHARASKKRAGRDLTWRDAEAALCGRANAMAEQYGRAVRACAPKAAAGVPIAAS